MTIQEAIKSGKRFRRAGGKWLLPITSTVSLKFNREAILANDYQIEEEKVEITQSQLINAISQIVKERAYGIQIVLEEYKSLLKELGFKN